MRGDVQARSLNGAVHNFFYCIQLTGNDNYGTPMNTREKTHALKKIIASKGSMLISYSGGVDSALLAVLATEVLGKNARCILLDSPVVPRTAIIEAQQIAQDHHLTLEIIAVSVMDDEKFVKNPAERCYWCKKSSARVLKQRKKALNIACIADGINVSDTGEHRPGLLASTEEGIVHPFLDAGITKADIREIAQAKGLPFWNKPSAACLSSRIPYGDEITNKKLTMIEEAEAFLHTNGFSQCRVRMHRDIARIEVARNDMQ
ncbi:MAG: ATP-dependent sacrificial sulfur transferase LarE, partial [Bacteroidota bacterium]|nr:ATP-dependent sacrificial sulfur transferase LarE [Bacteroidota bacterium]